MGEKSGIGDDIHFHVSRHTFGTLLMTAGVDLYTASKLMGHADVRTTQIYAKIIDSRKIEAVNLVDKMFEGIYQFKTLPDATQSIVPARCLLSARRHRKNIT